MSPLPSAALAAAKRAGSCVTRRVSAGELEELVRVRLELLPRVALKARGELRRQTLLGRDLGAQCPLLGSRRRALELRDALLEPLRVGLAGVLRRLERVRGVLCGLLGHGGAPLRFLRLGAGRVERLAGALWQLVALRRVVRRRIARRGFGLRVVSHRGFLLGSAASGHHGALAVVQASSA
jgi:hypothetical protein